MKVKLHRNEMAELFNINKETLRYYESKGLITPGYDKNNGYRCYGIKDIYDLNTILLLRKLNIPIKDIQKNMKEKNVNDYTTVLKESKIELEDQIRELKLLHQLIESKINILDHISERLNKIIIKDIPERKALFVGNVDFSTDDIRVSEDFFKNTIFQKNFQHAGFIYSIEKDTLYKEKQKIYVSIVDESQIYDHKDVITINEGKYLCYLTKGRFEENKSRLSILLKWIEDHHYTVVDRIYELDLPDFLLYGNEEIFVVEYQIPISERKK